MRSISSILVLALVAEARAEELLGNRFSDAQNSMDKVAARLVQKLVDKLVDRMLKAGPIHRAHLDSMTVAKPGHKGLPHGLRTPKQRLLPPPRAQGGRGPWGMKNREQELGLPHVLRTPKQRLLPPPRGQGGRGPWGMKNMETEYDWPIHDIRPMEVWLDCRRINGGTSRVPEKDEPRGLFDKYLIDKGEATQANVAAASQVEPGVSPNPGVEDFELHFLPYEEVVGHPIIGRLLSIDDSSEVDMHGCRNLTEEPSGRHVGGSLRISDDQQHEAAYWKLSSLPYYWQLLDYNTSSYMDTVKNGTSMLYASEMYQANFILQARTQIAVVARTPAEVVGLTYAEGLRYRGIDAVVVPQKSLEGSEGRALLQALQITKSIRSEPIEDNADARKLINGMLLRSYTLRTELRTDITLEEAEITAIKDGGRAERVCLDMITEFEHHEGCLVGSSPEKLAFLHAETKPSGFVPARPFRVNAGPGTQYIMMADGKSKQLSKVVAGDKVLVAHVTGGPGRETVVGRCKTEMRPLLRVEFQLPGLPETAGQVSLQQAETVRLGRNKNFIPSENDRFRPRRDYDFTSDEYKSREEQLESMDNTNPLPITSASTDDRIWVVAHRWERPLQHVT